MAAVLMILRPQQKMSSTALLGRLRAFFACVLDHKYLAHIRDENTYETASKSGKPVWLDAYLLLYDILWLQKCTILFFVVDMILL
jgi:hypothetical protein